MVSESKTMKQRILESFKSVETEDWLDYHVVRRLSYYVAYFFSKFKVTPNAVTLWSMVIGALSSLLFAHGCLYYEGWSGLLCNLCAMFLLVVADVLDCADGQLARMTGQKSHVGRILDGLAGFAWFIPIYSALVYRFYIHHTLEFQWLGITDTPSNVTIATIVVFILALLSGLGGLCRQQRLADYYIQVHLFFQLGSKSSELDNSAKELEKYRAMCASQERRVPYYERLFQRSYVDYTLKQEHSTPQFQRLLALLRERFGSADNMPDDVRSELHRESLSLMKWNGMMTFNFRSAWLFLFCLLDVPVFNFLFEFIVMSLLYAYVNHRHERFCRRVADKLEAS